MLKNKAVAWMGKSRDFLQSPAFCYTLIGIGVLIRLKLYLQGCSLNPDESYVAIETVHRSWNEVFGCMRLLPEQPLHPPGFTVLVKLSTILWGNHEHALRLVPFLSGIMSIGVFYYLLRGSVRPEARPLALGLFVLSGPLIYYSVELKPYSTDVLMTLGLLILFKDIFKPGFGFKQAVIWGLAGAAVIWISYASAFTLAGTAVCVLVLGLWKRKWPELAFFLTTTLPVWGLSALSLYDLALTQVLRNGATYTIWHEAGRFMPRVSFVAALAWLVKSMLDAFSDVAGLTAPALALLLLVSGLAKVYVSNRHKFFLLISPMVLALLGAALAKYPFVERLILFLAPALIIFITEGVCALAEFLSARRVTKTGLILGAVVVLLFHGPVKASTRYLVHGQDKPAVRQMVRKLNEYYREGDVVYLANTAAYPFIFYSSQQDFVRLLPDYPGLKYRGELLNGLKVGWFWGGMGIENFKEFMDFDYVILGYNTTGLFRYLFTHSQLSVRRSIYADSVLNFMGHKRAWVFLPYAQGIEKEFIIGLFDRHGQRVCGYEVRGAELYLYDLSRN